MKNYAYLIYVDNIGNHNKFYEITQNDDGSLDCKYGRVGSNGVKVHYDDKMFYDLVQSKIDKGYEDVTALHSVKLDKKAEYADLSYQAIPDEQINSFVEGLIKASNDFMKANYTVTANEITSKMVQEAEADLEELMRIDSQNNTSTWDFNQKLLTLFQDIPRRMTKVDDFLAKNPADFAKIITREQEMIDNIKGQLVPIQQQVAKKDGTVLDAYGLTVNECTYRQEDEIIAHLGKDYSGKDVERRFIKAYAIENQKTRAAYEEFKQENNLTAKDCRLFYHGSKTENWFSIMKSGLILNPDAKVTGKMFGKGLYFAPDARKSLNYMDTAGSCWNNGTRQTGFLAVYSVALGKCYKPTDALHSYFDKSCLPAGCLSVYADKHRTGLQNDEYVVYDPAQCTIKYLMEMKDFSARDLNYSIDRNALRNHLMDGFNSIVKTPDGIKAELQIEKLPQEAQNEMSRILKDYDIDRFYMEYNLRSERLTMSCIDGKGDCMDIQPPLTLDDRSFLCREMKKSFVPSEARWRELMKQAENAKTGEMVFSKSQIDNPEKTAQTKSTQVHAKPKDERE